MTTPMPRRGEPKGLLGWPQSPPPLTNHRLRLSVKVNAKGRSQLDLSHRGLTLIPRQVFQFQQLDMLLLSHNRLDQLPPLISYLRGIRTLHLQHNLLTALPPTLVNCRHLSELDLTHNRLTALPRGLGALGELRVLKVGENQLEQVPHELGTLANLRVMDLHGNRLWYVPFSFQNLHRLLRLDLSDNLFDQIPLVVTKLTWLRALDVSKNRLASLPPDFDQLRDLRELNLSENSFVALGVMVTKLRQLKYLSLSHNRLQFIPEQVSQLRNLRVLHLKHNCLEALPDKFLQLRYLNAAHNKLDHFSVVNMRDLVALDASANHLNSLPRGLFKLKQLKRLNLAQNKIVEVPEDIGWLKKLQSLDLSENDLRSLPASLHFLDKLTSLNVRGNHRLSRVPLTPAGEKKPKAEETADKQAKSRLPKHAKKQKQKKHKLPRQYASMPSLQDPSSSKGDVLSDQPSKSKPSSDWPEGGHDLPPYERSWLDNFLLAKPRRRASWDGSMRPHASLSSPYLTDEFYETGEIQTSFSAESLVPQDPPVHSMDPLTTLSFHSDDQDSALDASFSSGDDLAAKHQDLSHDNSNNVWLLDHKAAAATPNSNRRHMKSAATSTASRKSTPFSMEEGTQKKTPFRPTVDDQTHKKTLYPSTHNPSALDPHHTDSKLPHTSQPDLGVYDYRQSEESSAEPRQMNVLLTNGSQPSTVPSRHQPVAQTTTTTRGSQRMVRSNGNWTMRSNISQPLTIQSWTQTAPPEQNVHAGTQTRSLSPGDADPGHDAHAFTGLRSPDSPPMVASMGGYPRGRQRPAHHSHPSPFQPSLPSSSSLLLPASDAPAAQGSGGGGPATRSTDYTLLGVCNQIQTQLHRDLLQPVIGYTGPQAGRFSTKTIQRGHNGAWHWGQSASPGAGLTRLEAGLEYSPGETFTSTERGGHYVSAFCPHLQVSVPPGAVDITLHVTLQQLTIANHVLRAIGQADSYVSNLVSIGPIVFLHALEKVTFASPVTITLPAPVKVKGQQGHLVVVSVRADNTCVPCTTAYQSSKREVTLTTWHLTGKVAVLTKAKCKYKACKSVEQLLATLNILGRSAAHLHH